MRPASPVRPVTPAGPVGPGRSRRRLRTGGPERAAGPVNPLAQRPRAAGTAIRAAAPQAARAGRTSFVVLLLGLLGGGLVCLLVVNTTLAANSFEISNLQQENTVTSEHVQQMSQQVAADRSDSVIAQRAYQLGMRPDQQLNFLDLRTHSVLTGRPRR